MIDLYVYYKVREANAAHLAPLVRALQRAVGTPGRLKRRPETRDGLQTWMEVYQDVPEDFPAVLEAAAAGAGLSDLIEGPRRAEVFMELPACA